MKDAVIVSTARTGIGRAFKGAFNATKSPTMMGHAISHAVQRAGIDPAEIDDAVIGSVLTSGTAGMNLARNPEQASNRDRLPAPQQLVTREEGGLMRRLPIFRSCECLWVGNGARAFPTGHAWLSTCKSRPSVCRSCSRFQRSVTWSLVPLVRPHNLRLCGTAHVKACVPL